MHMFRDYDDVQEYLNQFIIEDNWVKFFSIGLHNRFDWNIQITLELVILIDLLSLMWQLLGYLKRS
jgi:hypothetical protein